MLDWITQSDSSAWLKAAGVPDLPLEELTNDQLLSSYLLESGVTSVRIPVRKTIEDFLIYYSRNKEALDEQFNRSMDFTYSVIDAFEDSG